MGDTKVGEEGKAEEPDAAAAPSERRDDAPSSSI